MSYCTQTDIENLLPSANLIQLADDDEDGVADAAVITEAIASADGDIDGYCQEKYTVPFTAVPEIIKNISVDLAIHFLYSRRDIMPEGRTARYKEAIRKLEKIAAGTLSLGADPEISESQQTLQTSTEDTDRIFDGDTMENF